MVQSRLELKKGTTYKAWKRGARQPPEGNHPPRRCLFALRGREIKRCRADVTFWGREIRQKKLLDKLEKNPVEKNARPQICSSEKERCCRRGATGGAVASKISKWTLIDEKEGMGGSTGTLGTVRKSGVLKTGAGKMSIKGMPGLGGAYSRVRMQTGEMYGHL